MYKYLIVVAVLFASAFVGGCKEETVQDVPNTERVPRKEWEDMTKDEKIEFIRRTPMSEEAKQKQIEAIERGEA